MKRRKMSIDRTSRPVSVKGKSMGSLSTIMRKDTLLVTNAFKRCERSLPRILSITRRSGLRLSRHCSKKGLRLHTRHRHSCSRNTSICRGRQLFCELRRTMITWSCLHLSILRETSRMKRRSRAQTWHRWNDFCDINGRVQDSRSSHQRHMIYYYLYGL